MVNTFAPTICRHANAWYKNLFCYIYVKNRWYCPEIEPWQTSKYLTLNQQCPLMRSCDRWAFYHSNNAYEKEIALTGNWTSMVQAVTRKESHSPKIKTRTRVWRARVHIKIKIGIFNIFSSFWHKCLPVFFASSEKKSTNTKRGKQSVFLSLAQKLKLICILLKI